MISIAPPLHCQILYAPLVPRVDSPPFRADPCHRSLFLGENFLRNTSVKQLLNAFIGNIDLTTRKLK